MKRSKCHPLKSMCSTQLKTNETAPVLKRMTPRLLGAAVALLIIAGGTQAAFGDPHGFDGFRGDDDSRGAFLPTLPRTVSTVPSNGDLNPYGVAFVPEDFEFGAGPLQPGDILVSNFNNSSNLQGTGTTIVRIPKSGSASTFFTATAPTPGSTHYGLSTALAVLRKGFIIVGNVPSTDGTAATVGAGSLLVIDSTGKLISTIADPNIDGPWDMALIDGGDRAIAFVSNVLSGTILRLDLKVAPSGVTVTGETVIASGYQHRADPAAFEVGPTGLVYDWDEDVLFVASTEDSAVFAVSHAAERESGGGTGRLVYSDTTHLHGPLAMAQAPNGDLLVSNSDVINPDPNQPSEIVEFTKEGRFVKQLSVDPAAGGSFGLAVEVDHDTATFAAVDDNTASLTVWTIPLALED